LHGAATKEKEGLVPLSAVSYIEPPGEAGNRDPEKVSGRKKTQPVSFSYTLPEPFLSNPISQSRVTG